MPRRLAREAGAAGRGVAGAANALPAHAADRAGGVADRLSGVQRKLRVVHAAAAQPGDYRAAPAVADQEFLSLAAPAGRGCVHASLEAGQARTVADAVFFSRRGGCRVDCPVDEVRSGATAGRAGSTPTAAWDFCRHSLA